MIGRYSRLKHVFAAGGILIVLTAAADEAPSGPQPGPTLPELLSGSGLTTSGYLAASYYRSSGFPANLHEFDVQHDTFQLDQAGLSIAYQPKEGFGGLLDVIAGEDARLLHEAEDGRGNSLDVKQAYLQYAGGPLTVIAGKFVTLAGAEAISPVPSTNFSRSLLFYENEPLTHTGFRATYAVNETLNLIAGINNGWNTTSTSYGSKTAELGVAWTPNKTFSLTAQSYLGKAEVYDAERSLVDIVATYNVTTTLTLVLNADWDQQKNAFLSGEAAVWDGVAGYLNYALNDQWRISLRAEYENDRDGFLTGTSQHLWEGTATVGFSPIKAFELRLEARYDKAASAPDAYVTRTALEAHSPDARDLSQVAVQGIWKFQGPQ